MKILAEVSSVRLVIESTDPILELPINLKGTGSHRRDIFSNPALPQFQDQNKNQQEFLN